MNSRTFLWIEDRKEKAGFIFGKRLLQQLCPDIKVESKTNNSELVKAVRNLKDTENRYIIVLDNSFDNLQVALEQKRLREYVEEKTNVALMNIVCFEYILLEFRKLIDWIYAPEDEFHIKRAGVIAAREKILDSIQSGDMDYKAIKEIIEYDKNIDEHNVEQIVAKILFDLTRNTGLEVSKGSIGDCWIKSCCDWKERAKDDICGLNYSKLSISDKMKIIYEETCLKEQFSIAGLEVA